MYSMKKRGQQGSPRGNIEKETGYIVTLMAVYTTWEMLLAESNTLPYIMWYMMVSLAKQTLAGAQFLCIYLNQSLKMQQLC